MGGRYKKDRSDDNSSFRDLGTVLNNKVSLTSTVITCYQSCVMYW